MQKTALITAGVVFALLAISHGIRWLSPIEILIDGNSLPFTLSLFSSIILLSLSVWMFVASKKIKPKINKDEEEL